MDRPTKPLSERDLTHFRDRLIAKRNELIDDLTAMEREAAHAEAGDLSHLPIHLADRSTDTFEHDALRGLAEAKRALLREVDDALERIEAGRYGICEMSGRRISRRRLEAEPWARHTVRAEQTLESETAG